MATPQSGDERSGIQVLTRAVDILRLLHAHPAGLTQTEISESLGLARSTASRLLLALEAEGFVVALGPATLGVERKSADQARVQSRFVSGYRSSPNPAYSAAVADFTRAQQQEEHGQERREFRGVAVRAHQAAEDGVGILRHADADAHAKARHRDGEDRRRI